MDVRANLGNRGVAIILDTLAVGFITGFVMVFTGFSILGISVHFLVGMVYNWYFWTKHNGQTPAKILMGVRVVSTNGQPISDIQAVIRFVGYYINTAFLLLGWIWAAFDEKSQGWHDKLAGTVVEKAYK